MLLLNKPSFVGFGNIGFRVDLRQWISIDLRPDSLRLVCKAHESEVAAKISVLQRCRVGLRNEDRIYILT